MVFYAQLPNQRIAAETGVEANHVALLKHRWIKQLREHVEQSMAKSPLPWDAPEAMDSLLTEIWEDQRPSCPRCSTVGGYVLGTLDEPWRRYVDFHINRLNCSFCRANLEESSSSNPSRTPVRSGIAFSSPPSGFCTRREDFGT